ncbi:MAG: GNAT family N-acetyltransferase [Planctomycetota bacterium]
MPDMLVKLYELPDPKPAIDRAESHGLRIRPAMAYERSRVRRWITEHFSEGWADEAEACFGRQPITCWVAVDNESGGLLGFACGEATCRGFFGPTGVDEAQRGKGLGAALLMATLAQLKELGYGYAVIGGVGPEDFYAKACGAVTIPGSSPGVYPRAIAPAEPTD